MIANNWTRKAMGNAHSTRNVYRRHRGVESVLYVNLSLLAIKEQINQDIVLMSAQNCQIGVCRAIYYHNFFLQSSIVHLCAKETCLCFLSKHNTRAYMFITNIVRKDHEDAKQASYELFSCRKRIRFQKVIGVFMKGIYVHAE